MHVQTANRQAATDPGQRSRFGIGKIIIVAIALVLALLLVVEIYLRFGMSTVEFRGNTYTATSSGCKSLPPGTELTTVGNTWAHPINGPSSIDFPAVIYVGCFPWGYKEYQTLGTGGP